LASFLCNPALNKFLKISSMMAGIDIAFQLLPPFAFDRRESNEAVWKSHKFTGGYAG